MLTLLCLLFSAILPIVTVAKQDSLTKKPQSTENYDMIIIAPSYYKLKINPLIEHKNNRGIVSIFVSTNDIYKGTFFEVHGRDFQEKIKYFILVHSTWLPECWSWKLTSKPNGGAIATIETTSFCWYSCEFDGGGTDWLNIQFFREYQNDERIIVKIWKNSLTEYLDTFQIDSDISRTKSAQRIACFHTINDV